MTKGRLKGCFTMTLLTALILGALLALSGLGGDLFRVPLPLPLRSSLGRVLGLQSSSNLASGQDSAGSPRRDASRGENCGEVEFSTTNATLKIFAPLLKGKLLCGLLAAADAFVGALLAADVPFFMYGGTLIGSWRHHGFVPWDDDMDFAVDWEQREVVRGLLKKLSPRFKLADKLNNRWKLYAAGNSSSQKIPGVRQWRYPFLDVNFFRHNASHVWDFDTKTFPKYVFPREWVLPTALRPFQGRWWPAPRRVERSLRHTYKLDQCETGWYNHRLERGNPVKTRTALQCRQLRAVLPFVRRQEQRGGCAEILEQGETVQGYHFFENTTCKDRSLL